MTKHMIMHMIKHTSHLPGLCIIVTGLLLSTALRASANDNKQSPSVPNYRFPADTTGPGLRLVSLLHDMKAGTFVQGLRIAKDDSRKSALSRPRYVTFGQDGAVYTLDGGRGMVYKTVYQDDVLRESTRLPAKNRRFRSPIAIACAPDGSLWLTDSRRGAVFVIDSRGVVTDSLFDNLHRPVGIVYHPGLRHMLVSDLAENTIVEISLEHEEHRIVKIHGRADSVIVEGPSFLAVGPAGNIYVVDALGGTVSVFSSEWKPLRHIGGFGDGPGFFSKPKGIAVDEAGRVYVADALFDNVQIFDTHNRLLLTLGSGGSQPGQFVQPMGIAIDNNGQLFIADSYNGRIQVYRWEGLDK